MLLVFDYGYKVTTFFHIYKLFLTFFHFLRVDLPTIANFVCLSPPFSGCRVCWSCAGRVCWSCVLFSSIIHTHTYARTYTRARGFLDDNF